MYALPESPTARDIIARSMACHPTLFAETLEAQATQDRTYLDTLGPLSSARQGVRNHAAQTDRALAWVKLAALDDLVAAAGPMVIALTVACKLQCLPPHMRTAAAAAWIEGKR